MRNPRTLPFALTAVSAAVMAIMSAAAPAAEQAVMEEIVVFGKGETRQVQTLTETQLEQYPSGTSPLRSIEKLPGVNFQAADPYGAYEWSTRIVVRGFGQNQLGFTLDGVPLGDMSYGNHNGLHISRAIMSENIGRVELSQGTGALSTASTSNLGGSLVFSSRDPLDEFGLDVNGSIGSDSAQRVFVRVDSGELGTAGTKLYVSYADQTTEKWKGAGDQEQKYINAKIEQPIGEGTLTGFYSWSDRAEIDYQDMSLEMIDRLGYDWDNFYPDYARAVATARGQFTGGVNNLDDAYWNASGLREDKLGYVKLDMPFGEAVTLGAQVYTHKNEGQGLWGTPYVPTPGGAPLSIRTTEYDIDRTGFIADLGVELGSHTISGGFWIEGNDFNQARRFYGEASSTAPSRNFEKMQNNPFLTQWQYDFTTDTLQFYVQDEWQINEALRLQFGFKGMDVEVEAETVTGANKSGKIKTDEKFLPQVGFVYVLNDNHEIFGDVAKNARALTGSATGTSVFSATKAAFDVIKDTIEPETSTSFELGWRFHGDSLEGVVTAYYVEFEDRLLTIQQGSAIIGAFNALANVGTVETTGIEAGLNWQINDWLYWYNSASFNESQYKDDFTSGTTLVPVSGKNVVDTPEFMFNSEVGIEMDRFFARLHLKYTDERYYTYLNDGAVDDSTIVNAAVGYRLTDLGFFKELTAQIDVTNLTDEEYISTVGSGGFSNSDPNGTGQTILPGAPRQAFFSIKGTF
jgi:iron complex outermembrane receptor protein